MADHFIGKQTIVLDLGGGVDSYDLQQRTSAHFQSVLLPQMEAIFDGLVPPDLLVKLENLEIDLGSMEVSGFEQAFGEKLLVALEKALRERIAKDSADSESSTTISRETALLQQLVHFLEKGWLPGWKTPTLPGQWEEKIISLILPDQKAFVTLETLLIQSGYARKRLARLASPRFLRWVMAQSNTSGWISQVIDAFSKSIPLDSFPAKAWSILLEWSFAPSKISDEEVRQLSRTMLRTIESVNIPAHWLEELLSDAGAPENLRQATKGQLVTEKEKGALWESPSASPNGTSEEGMVEDIPSDTAIHVSLAGLVLIHPFLSRFFEEVGLVQKGRFLDDSCREQAVMLLGYMAKGDLHLPEYDLVVPKLLCGMPLHLPIDPETQPNPEALAEARTLLDAVIGHWDALKNTSIEGLQEGFLRRAGRLMQTGDGWQIEVETQTLDILLSRLPWGLSMIHFPWNRTLIYVNWNA